MKIRYIPYLTIVLAALLLSACHSIMDDEVCADQPSDTTTPVQIGFTLTTGDVSSRAITEGEEAGTGYENYIDIEDKDFRILLFDATDDTYLTTFEPTSIRPADNTEYPQTYYVEGELSETYDNNFKLVVLANWGNAYPSNLVTDATKIEDVCTAATSTFSYTAPFTPSATQKIPMYGVKTCTETLRADLLTDLGTVDLLRAMAKIEVTCSAPDIELKTVTLHSYNESGMCAPQGIESYTQEWDEDTGTDCSHKIHLPNGITPNEGTLTFEKVGDRHIIYVPEFDNTDVTAKSFISVSVERNGTPVVLKNPNIFFGEYNDGTLKDNTDFDIVRNHYYKYTIANVDDGIKLQLEVMPWEHEEWTVEWSYAYDFSCTVEKNPIVDENETYYPIVYTATNDPSQLNDIFINFQLNEPAGTRWVASLDNGQDFFFCDPNSNNPSIDDHYVPGGYAGDSQVTIRIKAFGEYNPDNPQTVRFAIRVLYPEGTWNRLMNLIEENNGEDYILIKQVTD
ncbi:MAG TPA: hypothetical protein H9922_00980 [Candidatus Phocaeicola caecigallinarum]|nr:hypothetical protein [Candidatus Phocaeicola caecigallinarum]